MPNLTLIEGGANNEQLDRRIAEKLFQAFVVELLRQLATSDETYRVTASFVRLLEKLQDDNLPIGLVVDAAIEDLKKRAFGPRLSEVQPDDGHGEIVQASLQYVAERLSAAEHSCANPSGTNRDLARAIDNRVVALARAAGSV